MEITSIPEAERERLWGDRRAKLEEYYTKYLNVEGIVIIGSDNVPDNAFYTAKAIVLKVTSKQWQFRRDLCGTQLRLAPPGAWITDLPELREFCHLRCGLSELKNGVVKFCAAVVEREGRPNMSVLTHELGHAIVPSIDKLEPNFKSLLNQAYERAKTLGTWTNKLISKDKDLLEYWAEGVTVWTHDVGTGRRFETKEAFKEHDPGLAGLLDNWLHVGDIPYEY